ncbi:MAG TPA: phenylalanine--tRNA ligase subunit alpha, partial [Parachlamydiaceae bacterium]|nr:phenylalanine--tRNA ligase subunit alpha [Parachlamydiaceae bacterium]
ELKDVAPEKKAECGKWINDLKLEITSCLEALESVLIEQKEKEQLTTEKIDITLPGRRQFMGKKHLITKVLDELLAIFSEMGFSVQYGPDIDSDYYNFEALNFASDHPARDMQDTFYISSHMLLRTHTSNIQARIMETEKPPIRIVAPGRAYRNETITARSHVFFHQIEGFFVDKGVTFADLRATMEEFLTKFFEKPVELRVRPSYFPFVEPGLELDIHCLNCAGIGCQLCKQTGWLEILGAGMIHEEVLRNGDIDPEEFSGFAFGLGVERLVMLKYGIKDIRLFTENDVRFLQQF